MHGPTRLHSSRMRTARALTVSPSMICAGGCTWSQGSVPAPRGVYLFRGCTWSGGSVPGPGGVHLVWGDVPGPGEGIPGPGGVHLVLGGCTFSGGHTWWVGIPGPGGYLVPGGVPGQGVYLVWGGTWSGGVAWSPGGMYLVRYSPPLLTE